MLREKFPCRFMRSNARNKFKPGIGFGFPVVVYMYETPGRATNWVVLFKFLRGIHTVHPDVIICMSDADKNAPIFMLRRETKYCIDLICLGTGKKNFNKKCRRPFFPIFLKMDPLLSSARVHQRNSLWTILILKSFAVMS